MEEKMEKKTEIFIVDKLHGTKNKLRFICTGLTQSGCAWADDDIASLYCLLSDIENTVDEMYERIRQGWKQE